jgi:hypothetical protein
VLRLHRVRRHERLLVDRRRRPNRFRGHSDERVPRELDDVLQR